MDHNTLVENLARYRFYHTIDLGDGIVTPGRPVGPKQKAVLELIKGADLRGKRALDLGCCNGLFALAAEGQGAQEVIAVDNTRSNLEVMEKVILPRLNSKVKTLHRNVLDLDSATYGKFDLVIFAGLLYHLKFPFSALKTIRGLLHDDGMLIVETGVFDDFNRKAILYCPSPRDTPRRVRGGNSCAWFNEKALCETLEYFGIRVCKRIILTPPFRRFLKRIAGKAIPSYWPLTSIVLLCQRDRSLGNAELTEFYESTTP